ncbi:MAG: MotA/TolQ/ExbB proton channel family protein [Chromatiales bacterium]|nr:MotA/TolQ/ExbB proton channel family protein [Chromatiales bacterium]
MRVVSFLLLSLFACGAQALPGNLDELLAQVREARQTEQAADRERESRFLAEADRQQDRLAALQAELAAETARAAALQERFDANRNAIEETRQRLHERAGSFAELAGVYRQVWGDTKAMLEDSLVSSQYPERRQAMQDLALTGELPNLAQLEGLWFRLQEEMTESGKTSRYRAKVVNAAGDAEPLDIARVGPFVAVSQGQFLRYRPASGDLLLPARQPAAHLSEIAAAWETGPGGVAQMVIDPSRGTVIDLLGQIPDLRERLTQGRLVGYVIVGLAIIGVLVVLERLVVLSVAGARIRRQMVSETPRPNNPLGRIMAVYAADPKVDTETLERKLDEVIMKNVGSLQRGLGTVRILAAIAPMLGLLGTVVGLIETFQSITLFGTGDPRLMAGGISQALVTTVLGLSAAIPLILLHSLLSGKSRRLVGILEQQSAGIIADHAEQAHRHARAA